MSRAIINECAAVHNWGIGWIYDGKKNLFALPNVFPIDQVLTFSLTKSQNGRDRTFEIRIKFAKQIGMETLFEAGPSITKRKTLQIIEVPLNAE